MRFSYFLFLFFCIWVLGCGSDQKSGAGSQPLCTSATPPVFNDVSQIFSSNCDGCHGHNFSNFANALSSSQQIYQEVTSKRMPQGASLSAADLFAIQQWVACGSKE